MASIGYGYAPPPASTLPTGPLPGETPEAYAYRQYREQMDLEQQAEARAYAQWQQDEARRWSEYQQLDARAYGDYQQADARAYGDYQQADARGYNEARMAQGDAERVAQNNATLVGMQADNVASALRNRVNLADRYASAGQRGRQSAGGITDIYKRTLGGY